MTDMIDDALEVRARRRRLLRESVERALADAEATVEVTPGA